MFSLFYSGQFVKKNQALVSLYRYNETIKENARSLSPELLKEQFTVNETSICHYLLFVTLFQNWITYFLLWHTKFSEWELELSSSKNDEKASLTQFI